jgi:hypothetical protein
MLTNQEVIEIFASHDLTITEQEAREDLTHAMQDNPTYATLLRRIQGYAAERAMCERADGLEAAEHETNYE